MAFFNFLVFFLLSCFQEAMGTLHNSCSPLTIYAALPLEESSEKFSITFFKGSFATTLGKIKEYSCENCSSDQLGKDY